jgi:hypothetical protein
MAGILKYNQLHEEKGALIYLGSSSHRGGHSRDRASTKDLPRESYLGGVVQVHASVQRRVERGREERKGDEKMKQVSCYGFYNGCVVHKGRRTFSEVSVSHHVDIFTHERENAFLK